MDSVRYNGKEYSRSDYLNLLGCISHNDQVKKQGQILPKPPEPVTILNARKGLNKVPKLDKVYFKAGKKQKIKYREAIKNKKLEEWM